MREASIRSTERFLFTTLTGLGLLLGGFASTAAAVSCGDIVAPGQALQLTEDLGPCDDDAGPALTVDSGYLDLNGFTITCADTDVDTVRPVGVSLVGSKAFVVNGAVTGCFAGVLLAGDGKHGVAAVEVTDSRTMGFHVASDKNIIVFNSSDSGIAAGYQVDGDRNVLIQNVAENAGSGTADGFMALGRGNKLLGNAATGNDDGFFVGGPDNKLVANLAGNNLRGFLVTDGDTKLVKNSALANTTTGFQFSTSGDGLKVVKNFASANGGSGMLLDAAPESIHKFVKNEAAGNHIDSGFDLEDLTPGCGAHLWMKNTFETASDACIQ